jgi:hypothetical protein
MLTVNRAPTATPYKVSSVKTVPEKSVKIPGVIESCKSNDKQYTDQKIPKE